jgi:hypothetical protein
MSEGQVDSLCELTYSAMMSKDNYVIKNTTGAMAKSYVCKVCKKLQQVT